ncbi:MAG: 23S rRNA (adenine(2503)-C(2))-methyltransferase RlmN [Lachnospiraceae bacterium]|nr:23S rRNA (adenine(2503)-C(2))-methyltransferase RlmN [Lachnospiraceae bacterium]
MKDIRSLTFEELKAEVSALNMPAFRAKQIYGWLHKTPVFSFDEMTNISKADRQRLGEVFSLDPMTIADVQISQIDGTRKYLYALADGNMIESVWMEYKHGNSVCISTQVGCRMGCTFCASTIDGLARNLTAGEMLAQVYAMARETGKKVSNIVTMGSGEPMDNYDNVCKFIRMVSDENGMNLSQRNITVSTCGIVPNIKRFADEGFGVTLAISLHASNDVIRRRTMPIANAFSIDQIMEACRYFFDKTGRRLTFEYALIKGVNDSAETAKELAGLLHGLNCHVNLIPVNPIKERDYVQTERAHVFEFQKLLEKYGINATIRREMGRDIDGACGQLRKHHLDEAKNKQ